MWHIVRVQEMLVAFILVVIWRANIKFLCNPKWEGLYWIVTMENYKGKDQRAMFQASHNKHSELE